MNEIITNCPNCEKDISKEELSTGVKYKNEHAIYVYECPHCNENYKINPYQYLKYKKGEIEKLDSFKEFEDLPAETTTKFGLFPYMVVIAVLIYLFVL
ncbi:MAG: hypothetical protein HOG86_02145 [Candidatus Thioglobus sp.]|jgi:C4-type Zn-finger protein|nr:hypothetical protein [Candidatus Thioglobus sp.]